MSTPKALIYCRVATALQDTPHTGCDAQEARCRACAKDQDFNVARVFVDHASQESADRPGLRALLEYIEANSGGDHVVIADDLSRIHRSLPDLLSFREKLAGLDVQLDCVSTSGLRPAETELAEKLLAARAAWEDSLIEEEDA